MTDVKTGEIHKTVFVRANDSFNSSGLETGEYYIYIALGLGWDEQNNNFLYTALLSRFKDPLLFEECSGGIYGGYQYMDITLNVETGAGTAMTDVSPADFPDLAP